MKAKLALISNGVRQACRLFLFGGLSLAVPTAAQPPNFACSVVPLPSGTSAAGLSDMAGNNTQGNNTSYVIGNFWSPFGRFSEQALAWSVGCPPLPLDLQESVLWPNAGPAVPLPPLATDPHAVYATGSGIALGASTATVRVGYTVLHYLTPADALNTFAHHATSWTPNGAGGYVANDLDPTTLYFTSTAYGIVHRNDNSLLFFGSGANLGKSGFQENLPLTWTIAAPPLLTFAGPNQLATLAAGQSGMVFAGSKRSDMLTVAGQGGATLNKYPANYAVIWQAGAAINLNDPANLMAPAPYTLPAPGRANPNCGGAAYAVAAFEDPNNATLTDDIVAGSVIRVAPAARLPRFQNQAFVWTSTPGGGAPFTAVNLNILLGGLDSIANGVNASQTVVGDLRLSTGWAGFIATSNGDGTWSGFVATPDSASYTRNGLSPPGKRTASWKITSIKAINDAGVMIGTAQLGQLAPRPVLLIPNFSDKPYDPPPLNPPPAQLAASPAKLATQCNIPCQQEPPYETAASLRVVPPLRGPAARERHGRPRANHAAIALSRHDGHFPIARPYRRAVFLAIHLH